MNLYYEEWLKSGQNWMKAYRRQLMRKYICFIMPAVVLVLAAVGAGATAVNGGTTKNIADSAFAVALFGAVICFVFFLLLLPGSNPKRMSRNIKRAVKLLDMSEIEQEQLGREMLDAEKDSACVLDYKNVGPKSKGTPARFILSRHYACLWGSYPLVILIRLSGLEDIRPDEERKSEITDGAKIDTINSFTLYTINFYYKSLSQDSDNAMGFFSETIRDKVFDIIQKQQLTDPWGNTMHDYDFGEP